MIATRLTLTRTSLCLAGVLGLCTAAFFRCLMDFRAAKAKDRRHSEDEIQTMEAEGGIVLD